MDPYRQTPAWLLDYIRKLAAIAVSDESPAMREHLIRNLTMIPIAGATSTPATAVLIPDVLPARPITPPPAGVWIRQRTQVGEWYQLWHLSMGDVSWRPAWHEPHLTTRCGFDMSTFWEIVVADEQPALDACKRCARPPSTKQKVSAGR